MRPPSRRMAPPRPPRTPTGPRDEGQISVLILGLFLLVSALVLGAIDVTAAQLARMRLLDTTDAVALDAADALDEQSAYQQGLGGRVALTDASVRKSATELLARTPRPVGVSDWAVVPQTGSPDGATAVVTVSGHADLPMTGWFLQSLGGGVTITVTARARAPLG
ncbi:MAG: pilus assembly protein TadG-related protein [Terracoccus sp.]